MAIGNRRVELSSTEWTQVTRDTTSLFRVVNGNKANISWIVGSTLPVTVAENADAQQRQVSLTVDETMSRFPEMEGLHLYMIGSSNRSDDYVIVID